MRILVTGANGQVGQALRTHAQHMSIEIFACAKEDVDITSEEMVTAVLQRYQPDVVINAAAYTNVEQAEEFPEHAEKINVDAVGVLARACHLRDIPLLHISTDYVFAGTAKTPYRELDETSPLSVYGATKLAGEKQLSLCSGKFIILRTSWVFSATSNNFVKTMWRLFHEKTEVSVVNDQWGGPTSANAIAHALLVIAQRVVEPNFSDWGIYHFSGAPAVSWYDFANTIRAMCVEESVYLKLEQLHPISSDAFPTKAKRPAYSILNLEKINETFNINPCDWRQDLSIIIQQLKHERNEE